MFSEKSTEILRHVKRARIADIPCLIIKYSGDTRYGSGSYITTHDGMTLNSGKNLRIVEAKNLSDVEVYEHELVIAIDEGQFYPDIVETVDRWMRLGKKIYISALDGDFRRKIFGKIGDLIPLCTHVVKLHAICMKCKQKDASYTLRIVESDKIELIGSQDKYMATCLKCYLELYEHNPN